MWRPAYDARLWGAGVETVLTSWCFSESARGTSWTPRRRRGTRAPSRDSKRDLKTRRRRRCLKEAHARGAFASNGWKYTRQRTQHFVVHVFEHEVKCPAQREGTQCALRRSNAETSRTRTKELARCEAALGAKSPCFAVTAAVAANMAQAVVARTWTTTNRKNAARHNGCASVPARRERAIHGQYTVGCHALHVLLARAH